MTTQQLAATSRRTVEALARRTAGPAAAVPVAAVTSSCIKFNAHYPTMDGALLYLLAFFHKGFKQFNFALQLIGVIS